MEPVAPEAAGTRLRDLLDAMERARGSVRAQGLRGSSRAFLLARLLEERPGPCLVVTATLSEARRFADELTFYTGRPPSEHPAGARVVLYPPWESAPFEPIPPLPEVSARRLAALARARRGGAFAVVAPVTAVLHRTLPPDVLDAHMFELSVGATCPRDELVARLVAAGYHVVGRVEERGEASVRGGIVDLFPPFYPRPVRVELFGDEVDSLRPFDPDTQRSAGRLDRLVVLPARETPGGKADLDRAARRLRRRARELGLPRAATAEALENLRASVLSPLRDALFPYFFEHGAPYLWDHLPPDTLRVFVDRGSVDERAEDFFDEIETGYRRAVEKGRVVPGVDEVFAGADAWDGFASAGLRLDLEELEVAGPEDRTVSFVTRSNRDLVAALRQSRGTDRMLAPLAGEIAEAHRKGHGVWLVVRSPGSAERLANLLADYDLPLGGPEPFPAEPEPDGRVHLTVGPVAHGFRFPAKGLAVVAEAEILGEKVRRPPRRRPGGLRSSLADLRPGDPVVHVEFGVGLYRDLVRLEVAGEQGDYLHLEYAAGDRLYLPVTRIGLVQKYAAPGDGPPRLDKLGGKGWQRARRKAEEGIERMAHELLELYARRQSAERPPYGPPDLGYREFEATFPYEETPDQRRAIDDVMADMDGPRPMDRLVCGDVGYGKTELAVRAAFRAVADGRQVAVLVPTTVLAAQHCRTFRRRFEGYPVVVEMLSRFVTPADQRRIRQRIASGAVDVVVGTHRLLQRDVKFRELGLVVVDEEQRFGVAQKERLKRLRTRVDVLTLSATPIPRTLNLSLSGVRNLSVIETPPADRLAVRTVVAPLDDDVVRDAIRRELGRGGQVYFVHNRVQTIAEVAEYVRSLVPEARLGMGHGQMREGELEPVMEAFVAGETDVLVCTAIIESVLDIPRANTILIDRADRFGLADLYQLRGRVGRSNLRAYAYLLVPGEGELTADARKRLQVLQEFAELGAGFRIATHDLEIRGAGDLLGKAQSGHIAAIGFDLYADLLQEAVHRLRGEPVDRPPEPEIRLKVPAHFPGDYVEDPRERLELYERLTRVAGEGDVDEVRYELVDRFGPVPAVVDNLLEVMKIRRRLVAMRATAYDYTGRDLVLSFDERPGVDPGAVLAVVQSDPARFRVTPDHRVLWTVGELHPAAILSHARDLLNRLE